MDDFFWNEYRLFSVGDAIVADYTRTNVQCSHVNRVIRFRMLDIVQYYVNTFAGHSSLVLASSELTVRDGIFCLYYCLLFSSDIDQTNDVEYK